MKLSYPAKLKFSSLQCLSSSIQSFGIDIAFERDIQQWKLGWNMRLLEVVYCVSTKVMHSIRATFFLWYTDAEKNVTVEPYVYFSYLNRGESFVIMMCLVTNSHWKKKDLATYFIDYLSSCFKPCHLTKHFFIRIMILY